MNFARAGVPLTLLPNGKALIAGGNQGNAGCTAELFSNGQWSLTSRLAVCGVTFADTAALLPNGDVLIDAGRTGAGFANQFYDPSTNVWRATNGQRSTDGRVGPSALLATGKVLVAGCKLGTGGTGCGGSNAALYDPSTNAWMPTGSLKQAVARLTLTPLLNGKVLAAGGRVGEERSTTNVELYTP